MEQILYGILIILATSNVLCRNTTNSKHRDFTESCHVLKRYLYKLVDCSSRNLSHVPRNLPQTATIINLSNNNISSIFDSPFEGMSVLRELDLSDNPLASIQLNLFKGLSKLRKLSLKNSLLYHQEDLVLDTLLSDLLDLYHFSMTFKDPKFCPAPLPCKTKYRSQPFGSVDSLQYVDTLEIDSGLLKWHVNSSHLVFTTKSLHVVNGFFCYYNQLGEDQFEYMPLLENLSIVNPFFNSGISGDIGKSLIHLKHLAIYGADTPSAYENPTYLIYNVTSSVSGLHNLSSLIINNFSSRLQLKKSCDQIIHSLTTMVKLTSISLEGNSLSLEPLEFYCDIFPLSLKQLNIQNNCLSLASIYTILSWNKQIEIVNASDQRKCAYMLRSDKSVAGSQNKNEYNEYMLQTLNYTNSSYKIFLPHYNNYFPHLRYLDLSLNKVTRNKIPFSFSSRRPNLKILKMSECNIYQADEYSFSSFNQLEYLDLSRNNLRSMQKKLGTWFANLTSLKEINMASNRIQQIPSNFLNFMWNIEKIDLSGNEVNNFELGRPIEKLNYLNLSENRLQKLSKNTRNRLDIFATKYSVKVDLFGNMLLCTCETLDFLHRIQDTKVQLLRKDEYECSYGNGTRTSLKNIWHIVKHLRSDCASKTVFIVTISSVTAFGLLCLCAIFAYKFRWKIRYLYYKTKIKIPYRTTGHGYEQIFEYDVFVSYSTEDHKVARQDTILELETKRNLRVCIHERDFMDGESIAYNISKGIRSSKRTIIFLSSSFLASEWCMYELNIARMESLHTGRKVILVVLLENIPYKSLPIDVLDIIDTYTYLEYPKHGSRGDLDVFWSKCADFIS